jgi:hypothetical protein
MVLTGQFPPRVGVEVAGPETVGPRHVAALGDQVVECRVEVARIGRPGEEARGNLGLLRLRPVRGVGSITLVAAQDDLERLLRGAAGRLAATGVGGPL